MKVYELIQELKKFTPNGEVMMMTEDGVEIEVKQVRVSYDGYPVMYPFKIDNMDESVEYGCKA